MALKKLRHLKLSLAIAKATAAEESAVPIVAVSEIKSEFLKYIPKVCPGVKPFQPVA